MVESRRPRQNRSTTPVFVLLFSLAPFVQQSRGTPPTSTLRSGARNVQSLDCRDEPRLKSPLTSVKLELTVSNSRPSPVQLYWITFEGTRRKYGDIEPSSSTPTIETYAGHIWLIGDNAGRCLDVFSVSGADAAFTSGSR
jgi:hypothetical protein